MICPTSLRIASLSRNKVFQSNETSATDIGHIFAIDQKLIDILAKKLNFSYTIVSPADGEYGTLLQNGSWTGMVAMILSGKADLIVDGLTLTEQRARDIDFSYPYYVGRWVFVTRNLDESYSTTSYLKPFSTNVWIVISVCVFLKYLISHAYIKAKKSCTHLNIIVRTPKHSSKTKMRTSACFLKAGYMLGHVLIRFSYTSVLLSFLVFPSLSGVQTIPELAKAIIQGTYQCTAQPGTFILDALLRSSDAYLRAIGKSVEEYRGAYGIDDAFENHQSQSNLAYITSTLRLPQNYGNYFISEDVLFYEHISIGMKKNFCYKTQIDSIINFIVASGVLEDVSADNFHFPFSSKELSSKLKNKFKPLSFRTFESIFVLLTLGCIIALLLLVIEVLLETQFLKTIINYIRF